LGEEVRGIPLGSLLRVFAVEIMGGSEQLFFCFMEDLAM